MCEFDPRCDGTDELVRDAIERIAVGSWSVTGVFGDAANSPFAYTSGLTDHGLPELVITGLSPDLAGTFLNEAARKSVTDARFCTAGYRPSRLRRPVTFSSVDVIDTDSMRLTRLLYGEGFRAVQLVWPDESGCFPWDPSYDIPREVQPLLGVPARVQPF